jgi:signal transduction histidine kinase
MMRSGEAHILSGYAIGTLVAIRIAGPEGRQRTLRISVAIDQATLEDARAGFASDILPSLAMLGLFLIGASIAQLAFGSRPLSSLNEGIDRIREHRDTRLTGSYPAEFQTTVKAMNQFLETQDVVLEKARSRAADLAHGLRTPLTVLSNDALTLRERGETELAGELESLAHTMRAHVERQLALSRIARRPDLRHGDSDIARLAGEIVRTVRRTPEGERVTIHVEGPAGLTVPVDPGDFRELAGNLIENALKWAQAGLWISWGREVADTWFAVSGDGPGVPETELANLTRRGWRLDSARPGTGLGLSIVREIADVYALGFELARDMQRCGVDRPLNLISKIVISNLVND